MQKFAQGSSQARRLIRTESSYITGQIDLQSYEECGIEKYVYLATLDLRTCQEDCAPLDGKIFPVKDAKSGVNMPPMHPWCRCTTISYFSDEILRNLRRRARDPVTGKTYTVPGDMTYKQWYGKYVKDQEKSKELIVKESKSDIMISGARITDPDSDAGEEFAKMYYNEIRNFSTDTKKISQNLGKKESDIKKIKAYLFEDKSLVDLETGMRRRFDPDCAIAQSWQRLMIGKDIKPHDRTLIEHELLEMKIKEENPAIDHLEAHRRASEKYDYPKEVAEYYGNLKKYKKNG